MPLTIRPATSSDIPAIARISVAAFHPSTDAVTRNLFPTHLQPTDQPDDYAHYAWRVYRKSARVDKPGSIMLVVVDDALPPADEVVGFAIWDIPGRQGLPSSGTSNYSADPEFLAVAKASMDESAFDSLRASVGSAAKDVFGEAGYGHVWHLDYVAVDPNHQRRGVGKMLLQWGLDRAAADGKDCFLMATPAGRPLYLASGFQQVGEFSLFGAPHFSMIIKNDEAGTAL